MNRGTQPVVRYSNPPINYSAVGILDHRVLSFTRESGSGLTSLGGAYQKLSPECTYRVRVSSTMAQDSKPNTSWAGLPKTHVALALVCLCVQVFVGNFVLLCNANLSIFLIVDRTILCIYIGTSSSRYYLLMDVFWGTMG